MRRIITLFAFAAVLAPAVATAQAWPDRPDDPAWQAERLRLQREQWRTRLELRQLHDQADQARTDAVIRDIQARRSSTVMPPAPGAIYLGPVDPALVYPNPAAAAQARRTLEQGLSELSDYLDQTRPD